MRPVLLVHGIWDTVARLEPLRAGLAARGVGGLCPVALRPNTGSAPLRTLAESLAQEAAALSAATGYARVDVVGFSMGALVTRLWIQRLGGRDLVRRFVSVSGPHHGTRTAWGLPLAGVREMRPGSVLLRDLAADPDPFGAVEVHCLYTPWDLMVQPAESAILPGSRSVCAIPVWLHRAMITDPRSLDAIAARLRAP